ncbi:Mu transposase C-terminal domain-containing protein [Oleispirillum naphthae]|uniref:Mu transposase C-terminal domain-containing protein n=1 Tax=Oleispirillum naphthae TaxID=2838853 RepID=UPI0030825652
MSSRMKTYRKGTSCRVAGRACTIRQVVAADRVLVRFKDTGDIEEVSVAALCPLDDESVAEACRPVDALTQAEFEEAQRRRDVVKELIPLSGRARGSRIREIVEEIGVSKSTLYRWLRAADEGGTLSALAPQRAKVRKRRLSKKVEAIASGVIENAFLTMQKLKGSKVVDLVRMKCRAAHLKAPSEKTIRSRLNEVDARRKTKMREGRKAARDRYDEVKGAFPGAEYPLDVVQIDHTPLDIEVVDDEHRLPIGRPWLTLAMDVCSRMVTGLYLSLDAPSAFSVGMCIRHSVLEKDAGLGRLGVAGQWPVWGMMKTLHADNGKDFRSELLRKACEQHGVNLAWRPVRTPHYGGHIERILGTFAGEIHALPGTTFSNVKERGEYKSDQKAVMTLDELERWLTDLIVNVYHKKEHSALKMPPLVRWQQGIVGDGKRKGIGLPDPIANPERLRLDFLPFTERSVQREGIAWDNVFYYADVLRPWINARKGRTAVKFLVRRDPRDISRIWFFDPKIGDYVVVPYRTLTRPSISVWELRAATARVKEQGRREVDEDGIFEALARMQEIVETASKETRKARRARQAGKQRAVSLAREAKDGGTGPFEPRLVVDNDGSVPPKGGVSGDERFEFSDEELKDKWERW